MRRRSHRPQPPFRGNWRIAAAAACSTDFVPLQSATWSIVVDEHCCDFVARIRQQPLEQVDMAAGARNRSRVGEICDPTVVAKALAEVYDDLAAA